MTKDQKQQDPNRAHSMLARALRHFGLKRAKPERTLASPTYADLILLVAARPHARRNRQVLRDWMTFRNKQTGDLVCDVMKRGASAQWVKAHAAFVRSARGVADLSRADRKMAIRTIRSEAMRISAHADNPLEHARWEMLRTHLYVHRERLFRGIMARDIPYNFRCWLDGEHYCFAEKSRPKLALIEQHLGLAQGTFLSHSRRPTPQRAIDLGDKAKSCMYRIKLEHELTGRILTEIESYFQFKTDPAPTLRRNLPWTPTFKGDYPSRRAFAATLKAYWNFAVRPKAPLSHPRAGLGLDPDRLEFIDFFRSSFLIAFLRWHFHRTQKASPGAITTYYGPFASIMNAKTGWIAQQPERFVVQLRRSQLRRAGDPGFVGNAWAEEFGTWATAQIEAVAEFRQSLGLNNAAAHTERIRDSFEKIDEILRLPQPLSAVMQLIRDHDAHQAQMVFLTDIFRINYQTRTFLLACLAALPLRCLTWTALVLGRNVFRRDGRWVVRIERGLFKNRRHLVKRHYEVTLAAWATPYFDRYVDKVRPRTVGARAGSKYLFPVNSLRHADLKGPVSPSVLQHSIRQATRQHWNAEVMPHAWRHICATGILKDDPEQIVLAATVLNDSPKTVMKAYAHILPDDAFKAFAAMGDRLSATSRPRNSK